MNEMQIFNYGEIPVRTVLIDSEPWWVLADVCRVLDLKEPHRVASRLDEDEKGSHLVTTPGGPQEMTIISESGLYKVILRSDKAEAKPFSRWVTHDVLPAIRKTGHYGKPAVQQRALTPDDYLRAASIVANCANGRLPYVLGLLEKGGFEIPKVEAVAQEKPELALVIAQAIEDFGITITQIGQLLGVTRAQVYRYKNGSIPRGDRAEQMIQAIREVIDQPEE